MSAPPEIPGEVEAVARALAANPAPGDYDEVPADEVFVRPRYIHMKHLYERQARAAMEASRTALEKAGMVVVPREPTAQMRWEGQDAVGNDLRFVSPQDIYKAMIAAAEAPPGPALDADRTPPGFRVSGARSDDPG